MFKIGAGLLQIQIVETSGLTNESVNLEIGELNLWFGVATVNFIPSTDNRYVSPDQGTFLFVDHFDQSVRVNGYIVKVVDLSRGFGDNKVFNICGGYIRLITKLHPKGSDSYN